MLAADPVFRRLAGGRVPSIDTVYRDLARFDADALEALEQVVASQAAPIAKARGLAGMQEELIDIDTTVTVVFGEKHNALPGPNPRYHGRCSYHPILARVAKTDAIIGARLRPGDTGLRERDIEDVTQWIERAREALGRSRPAVEVSARSTSPIPISTAVAPTIASTRASRASRSTVIEGSQALGPNVRGRARSGNFIPLYRREIGPIPVRTQGANDTFWHMRNRLYLYVLPVLAIVACKEALPLVDGGDPEADAQTPEQDASSLTDGALADAGSPDSSPDGSTPQDGGGDALDASADAYVAPSEDGGVVTGYVWLEASERGSWSVPSDGGGLRKCAADASAGPDGCCLVPIPRLEGGNLAQVTLNLTTGVLTIGGRPLPTLQVSEKDAGYFEGNVFPSTFATVPVVLDTLSTTGSAADRTEVAAFFAQPNLYGAINTFGTVVFASWDRTTQKLIVRSGYAPQWSNNGCRTNGNASFQSR